ncbi:hypothetical protein GQ44DRAFT_753179 [Phaeosphaeriaceae sp. PMI808]|nr:hypothetical protein GQ44DRAFT_753179 [Phaeosphaeriaceae sp. PMI808]
MSFLNDGGFSLVEYVGNNIPPYAILSHTWGLDNDEVTFRDLVEGRGKDKTGYRKLTFCGDSAELLEVINSMFRWYRDAAKCYVYLSDMLTTGFPRNSLLAPTCVEFFSMEGDLLGDKGSRVISTEALQGKALSHFSTTREEDIAYSLLGIFDIHMPLIYGEGKEKALKRL